MIVTSMIVSIFWSVDYAKPVSTKQSAIIHELRVYCDIELKLKILDNTSTSVATRK